MDSDFGKLSDLGEKRTFMVKMTKEEILEKAIQRVYNNGWRDIRYGNKKPSVIEGVDYTSTIFSHEFAKALWPDPDGYEVPATIHDNTFYVSPVFYWQHHLQQMVIADDPIQYLGEHLDG